MGEPTESASAEWPLLAAWSAREVAWGERALVNGAAAAGFYEFLLRALCAPARLVLRSQGWSLRRLLSPQRISVYDTAQAWTISAQPWPARCFWAACSLGGIFSPIGPAS